MLDSETKSRIDSARDILVGKVPDPKSQVEQITIALIYKFMDDMDRQSEEVDGKASFFKGEFKRYRWTDLLDKRLGGQQRLNLYAEGLEKMNENKNIPQLFRDIFKGVFLPYRDPETLNLFLKEINGFSYDHSERLGDAYEYLLNVLGTQGDAGQFRTPRHIIDFIVKIVDPQKHETVLDPACGTAGFLISAYKHILSTEGKPSLSPSDGERAGVRGGNILTPDERARLMTNFCGYDIAPDMVRLSRVNMYLHGFPSPIIHEYDALTSEERWDERYDVIMANPPFMTPKGGIRPHNRFSIRANRSEVLFVDYIAEHLNPGGRAGVIVPEGVIFQSQNAYRTLRKMLVENYLWAVVSLPAGVFNPYSGVKTSVLFLDRDFAKRTDEVLFVKIENDGFDLGAQRRPVAADDMPQALKTQLAWKANQKAQGEGIAHAVSRKRLLESPYYNFLGDRYRPSATRRNGQWPVAKVGELCIQILSGGTPSTKIPKYWNGEIPWITSADIQGLREVQPRKFITRAAIEHSATNLIPADNVVVVTRVGLGKVLLNPFDLCISQDSQGLVVDKKQIRGDYLAHMLSREVLKFKNTSRGSTIQGVVKSQLAEIEIPLPPLPEQERLVAELEGYRKIIEAARQILARYKPNLHIDPKWPMVRLEDVCQIKRGRFGHRPRTLPEFFGGPYPFIQTGDVVKANGGPVAHTQTLSDRGLAVSKLVNPPVVLVTIAANIGDTALLTYPACFPDSVVALTPSECIDVRFLEFAMRGQKQRLSDLAPQAAQKNINVEILRAVEIPLPPLATQRELVADLESERSLVESNRELIARMEKKMQARLAEIWGEEKTDAC